MDFLFEFCLKSDSHSKLNYFFPGNINLYVVRIQRKYFYTQYEVKVQVFNDMCDHMQCSGPTSLPVTIYSAEDLPQVAPTQVGARPFNSTGILNSMCLVKFVYSEKSTKFFKKSHNFI